MSEKMYTLTITIPKSTKWEGERASQFMHQMLMGFGSLIFRIVATYEDILWQIIDPLNRDPFTLQNAIRATYPDADVQIHEYGFGDCQMTTPSIGWWSNISNLPRHFSHPFCMPLTSKHPTRSFTSLKS